MNRLYYIISFLLLCSNLAFGQAERFTAAVSKNPVAAGEQFEVSFTLNANGDQFTPPRINGSFEILSGPNMSQSMTSVNGNTSMAISYSYYLLALKEGTYTIGSASIIANGKKLSTQPISLKVTKGQPVQQRNSSNAQNQVEEAPSDVSSSELAKSIFIRAEVDKSNVYQGEQLTLSYRLYTRVNILNSQLDKLPELNGFWSQDIIKDLGQNVKWRVETFNGMRYNVADLKQTILFPERSGKLTIDPMAMTFSIRVPVKPRDVMEEFFGSFRELNYQAKSKAVNIQVRPLPDAGKPEGFAGAVGKFSVSSSVDKSELKANEPLKYQVKITGTGNLKLLKTISTDFPPDFEKYDPKLTDKISETINGVSGSRVYDYLLIPRHEGNFTLAPLKFSYFNPASGKYVSLSSEPFQIKVNKGNDAGNVTAYSPDQQDIKLLNKDIRYIKTGNSRLGKEGEQFYGSGLFYGLLLSGPAFIALAFAWRRWDEKNNNDPVKVKSRNAGKLASKHLANAAQQLKANNPKAFYEDLFKGLYGYLSDKFNIPYSGLDRELIQQELRSRSVTPELISSLLQTIDLCEMARYAPVKGISEEEVFEKVKGIIKDIEASAGLA